MKRKWQSKRAEKKTKKKNNRLPVISTRYLARALALVCALLRVLSKRLVIRTLRLCKE